MKFFKRTYKKYSKYANLVNAFIGILGFIIIFYTFYQNQRAYKIESSGNYTEITYPSLIDSEIEKYEDANSIDKISEMIPKLTKQNVVYPYEIREYYSDLSPRSWLTMLKSYETMWEFEIENVGRREITNLSLNVPFEGLYSLMKSGQSELDAAFDKSIALDFLRPSEKIKITIWTSDKSSQHHIEFLQPSNIYLTHSEGEVKIKYPQKFNYYLDFIFNVIKSTVMFALLLFGVPTILNNLYNRIKPSKNKRIRKDKSEKKINR